MSLFRTTKCATDAARLKFEQLMDAQEIVREQVRARVMDEFARGKLDDAIRDVVADYPMDATCIALHACYPKEYSEFAPSVTDFMASVEHLIDKRVDLLMEDL